MASREHNRPWSQFCPDCEADSINMCHNVLHGLYTVEEVWEYALRGGILSGSEFEDLDPYK